MPLWKMHNSVIKHLAFVKQRLGYYFPISDER